MAAQQKTQQNQGPNLKALGLKSPMEVIDLLALLRIDGQPVITDNNAILDPNLKAKAVMEFYHNNFNVKPGDLPYLASLVKHNLKNGNISWRNN
jgi:hypothetical protein